jgi:hypothetical protein
LNLKTKEHSKKTQEEKKLNLCAISKSIKLVQKEKRKKKKQ